jgi:hypothetical protein
MNYLGVRMTNYKKLIIEKCKGISLQHILKIKNVEAVIIDQHKQLLRIFVFNDKMEIANKFTWLLFKNNKVANFSDQSKNTQEIIYNLIN